MGHIQLMSAALANQIAAGEVVVRPASCVKELIENSLDARARAIQVHLREGGIAEIVVIDDGQGMDEQDAALAFRRTRQAKSTSRGISSASAHSDFAARRWLRSRRWRVCA
ncbi:hypothetical protein GCM10025858_36210 [Alicyclobacillus sacchari]|uniref:ATP-binding protein n=1 Tax=Alicyclobacillus sacchari TaxID=392010 RepID=UPI0023E99786|nr:ATP-binding protein [Alicyclobacillus sacchari]GMA59118.1 hypothetical protein GCM10025858_36210 [Alicyclobacillus sacchari]